MEQLKWYEYLLPTLECLSDKKTKTRLQIISEVSDIVKLPSELRNEVISNGEFRHANRIGWALTYLKQSGLISSPKRSNFLISELGVELLNSHPSKLTEKDLEQYEGYWDFKGRKKDVGKSPAIPLVDSSLTPEEMIDSAEKDMRRVVCADLLEKAKNITPSAFEDLVVDLIKKMGYGDENDPMSGLRIGGGGDGGIDGVVKQDKLGLDVIYIQAKRYKDTNTVAPKIVREFIGSLATKGARKGIIITTSSFTTEAKKHAEDVKEYNVILIDGAKLAELMYEFNVGVSEKKSILIKKLDNDYFEE